MIWRRVNKRPADPEMELSRFKAIENTNYSIDLARQNNMIIVGTQGSDIVDGNKTLVLGLVWQLMRLSIQRTLRGIGQGGREMTDSELVRWANDTVKKSGKSSSMRSFKDPSLKTGVFCLDLLNGVKPGYVDYALVKDGRSDEDCKQNGTRSPFVRLSEN